MDEQKLDISKVIVLHFSPQHWGELERFNRFWPTTHTFDYQTRKRISGILGHFQKAGSLLGLARRLEPSLEEDETQLKEHGYSPAGRSRELAAVVETIFCELYSVLDCFRFVLCKLYPNHKGVRDSTRSTFQNGHKEELDSRLPETIRRAIKGTETWYPELLRFRDEITHANVGSCHRNKENKSLFYMHSDLGDKTKAFILEDVFSKIEDFYSRINSFLGIAFRELNSQLKDSPSVQICGIFGGRVYQRIVSPHEAVDFHGGTCKSREWFEKEENPNCPLMDKCGAYKRAKEGEEQQ